MKTILVPTDFSKDASDAALYAANFGKHFGVSRIVLLNSFYVSIYESIFPSADFIQLSNEEIAHKRESLLRRLRALKARLKTVVGEDMIIETRLSSLPLLSAIQRVTEEQKIDIVVIGSAGENAREENILGRNTVRIARICPVPVIVCPPQTAFSPIKKVVLACDFKKVTDTIPLNELERLLTHTQAELLVLNVDPQGRHLESEAILEESTLRLMLKDFNSQYHYTEDTDTIDGVMRFAQAHSAQLIIALPKKYSFFQGLLHVSVSKKLVLSAKRPVLILK